MANIYKGPLELFEGEEYNDGRIFQRCNGWLGVWIFIESTVASHKMEYLDWKLELNLKIPDKKAAPK